MAGLVYREERGQDLAEWCLITALVALVCIGIIWHVSGGLQGIWTQINATTSTAANSTANGPGASPMTGK